MKKIVIINFKKSGDFTSISLSSFDMIMTDRPEQLILFLESRGLR